MMHLNSLLLLTLAPVSHAFTLSGKPRLYSRIDANIDLRIYHIPALVQNGSSHARFDIQTPLTSLGAEIQMGLDGPQVDRINASVFDWWYFDAVSDTDPRESLAVTFFTSSAAAFPFLDASESSVLIAYLWASFANGTIFTDFVPATAATVAIGSNGSFSSGQWSSTGFSWAARTSKTSQYEIVVASEKMQVNGRFRLSSVGDDVLQMFSSATDIHQRVPLHLPCGIQSNRTSLEIAPHIGWVSLVPDAEGVVEMEIRGSTLRFRGAAYHDKNWSDRPFMDSVRSWYWGHGRLGSYSIVWFSYLALDDPSNTTYVSSYVAKDGVQLVSSCNSTILRVRPIGRPGTTGGRYPPHVGDVPQGFRLQFDLGPTNGWLMINVSAGTVVAGDGQYYMRWTGKITGEMVQSENRLPQQSCAVGSTNATHGSPLTGVAVFEQFALVD